MIVSVVQAGRPPEHHGASLGPGRGPWHVLWGFKVAKIGKSPRGGHSEHVEPSRPMQTHLRVEKMSDGLHMSFTMLLTARTIACPPRARGRVLVVVLSALVLVRARASFAGRSKPQKFSFSGFLLFVPSAAAK